MAKPSFLYRNMLALARDGRGDGTIYASGANAVPDADAMTFDLTTITFIDEITESDDILEEYVLVFTASGRQYTIVGYTASTDVATVAEVPNASDIGVWSIRSTIRTSKHSTDTENYPSRNIANGRLYQKWKGLGTGTGLNLVAAMPNGVDDGGFELYSVTDYWTKRNETGTATVDVNITTPILGTYDCKFNIGDQTYVGLEQPGKIDLKAGTTYGIVFKAGGDGGAVTDFRVSLEYVHPGATRVPVNWTEINAEDDTATTNIWKPSISDANAWEEVKFTVNEDIDAGDWKFVMDNYDSTDVFIDEVYVFEVIDADTFICGGHNFAGGWTTTSYLRLYRCPPGRSSAGASDYTEPIDIDANVTVDGNSPIYETFAASTSIFPVVHVFIGSKTQLTPECGEVWVGQRWTLANWPEVPLTGKTFSIESVSSRARGGPTQSTKLYQQRVFRTSVELIDGTEVANWTDFIQNNGYGNPFWLHYDANSTLGVSETNLFVRTVDTPNLEPDPPIFYRVDISLEEAF